MKQLYDLGVRGFWFTDAQFIPAKNIADAKHSTSHQRSRLG